MGIRVFPNAIPEGIPEEKTFEQIGKALAEVSNFANDQGIEIRVCVHGNRTNSIPVIKKIIDEKGRELDCVKSPKQICTIHSDVDMSEMGIIRKKR